MFKGIQKAVYPGIAGFLVSLVGQILTGQGGPTDADISQLVNTIGVTFGEIITSTLTGFLVAIVAYIRKNVNVNDIVMSFVDRQGNVQDANGKVIGSVETGATVLKSPMWVGLAVVSLLALGACDAFRQAGVSDTLRQAGVSDVSQQACSELLLSALNDEAADVDLVERLKASGLMCLAVVVDDVMTVDPVPATTETLEGELVAGNAEAAEAIE